MEQRKEPAKRVICLGFFDGVHLGHQSLLDRCRSRAKEQDALACALTFDVHPMSAVTGRPAALLIPEANRRAARLMERGGMDEVLVLPFDREMAAMPYERFVADLLIGRYRACHLVMGESFTCGALGKGTPEKVAKAAAKMGVACDILPNICVDGEVVSSTRIRALLQKGEIAAAERMLGYSWAQEKESAR